jgi:hypothetical protein
MKLPNTPGLILKFNLVEGLQIDMPNDSALAYNAMKDSR